MNARRTARIVGALFIIGTVSGILSAVAQPVLDDPEYLVKASASENQIILGAPLVLIMGIALALVPVMMYRVLKQHNETLALGYVVFRGALETFFYIATVICWLLLLTLSREYVGAGAPHVASFQNLGALVQGAVDWINPVLEIVFSLGALMFYSLFYQSRLIPRWLSGWGLIGAVLYLTAGLITLFDSELMILLLPLAVNEMVLALWLIVKGFDPAAIGSEPSPVSAPTAPRLAG